MTIAIAACLPRPRSHWGIATGQPAMVLMTDSRFSFAASAPLDSGRKIYILASNAGLVFSGDVQAAQRAEKYIRRYRERSHSELPSDLLGDFANLFRRAYQAEKDANRRGLRADAPQGLTVLVGGLEQSGATTFRFSHTKSFAPVRFGGIQATGNSFVIARFWEELIRQDERDFAPGRSPGLTLEHSVLALGCALKNAVDAFPGSNVGGPLQLVIIDANGAREETFAYITLEGNSTMSDATPTQFTTSLDDVRPHWVNAPRSQDDDDGEFSVLS